MHAKKFYNLDSIHFVHFLKSQLIIIEVTIHMKTSNVSNAA